MVNTPHDLYRQVLAETGDRITAIRLIRERFGLDLTQAKEVMIQAEGWANSLKEHQDELADALEREINRGGPRVRLTNFQKRSRFLLRLVGTGARCVGFRLPVPADEWECLWRDEDACRPGLSVPNAVGRG